MSDWRTYGNGNGAQSNGNSSYLNRFDFHEPSSHETSADERSRSRGAGGYGGLGGYAGDTSQSRVQAPGRLERQYGRRSRPDAAWTHDRNRSRGNTFGSQNGQIEDTLSYIERQWAFMAAQDCVPIKIALQLNDSSSLGLMDRYDQFQEAHHQLQNALKVIVNEHHQGFNSSIGTFHKIQTAIHTSQQRVRTLKASLLDAKGGLASAKPELKVFAQSSQTYDNMLSTLAAIEELQAIPDRLEAQISEKRFLGAVDTLLEALKVIRKPEMEEIGALSDLKVYLGNQEHSLTDILIEELHAHLYLKSPYCEERWKSRAKRDPVNATIDNADRAMAVFLELYDGSKAMQEDPARNPEADTFYYIQLLLESLHKMGKLEGCVDAIEQRLPIELFRVVERSHSEVEQNHPQVAVRHGMARANRKTNVTEGLDQDSRATLEDLLVTLYAKFEAIAEGHRVLFDVMSAISKRDEMSDPQKLNRSFRELWKLLQSEIRTLLHDHLTSDGDLVNRIRSDNDATTHIFKASTRDRSKKLFKLTESDDKSSDLATEREDLEFILKASVPGLVSSNTLSEAQKVRADALTLTDRSATGHKLLVTPSVFNMGVLLGPSLYFLNHLKEIVPSNSGVVASTLPSFLDDFLINVFYPQLDETMTELVTRCMMDLDAYQIIPSWGKYSATPIFKGTVKFFEIIEGVCRMLDTLPHDQSFSQLVISQMRSYYDRCYTWSKTLLQRTTDAQPKVRLAADLATSGDVSNIVIDLLNSADGKEVDTLALATKEATTLIDLAKSTPINEADLILDDKQLGSLCALHASMKWLAARCQGLRFVSPRAVDVSNAQQSHHNRRWTTLTGTTLPTTPYLPLDTNTSLEFDGVVSSLSELGALILRTLHIDIRLHILHFVTSALRTTYALEQPYNDPDPAILKLSSDLSTYDTQLSAYVLPRQYQFLTANLHLVASSALVTCSSLIPAMDQFGLARMILNVAVLQQSLKNVQSDATLASAEKYYRLGSDGCEAVIARGRKAGFKNDDLKNLLRLVWDEDRDGRGGSVEDHHKRLDLYTR